MQLKAFLLAGMASNIAAQSLTEALAGESSISNLTTYLNLYPDFTAQLGGMSNITLLAPNNEAFTRLLNSSQAAAIQANDSSTIEALLSYHVLNGTYANFSSMPQFLHTSLQNPTFANLTGGQAVEAITSGNGSNATTTFYSGLLQNSTTVMSTVNFTGGVIHVIDSFLTIPSNISSTAIELGLSSAVGALIANDLASTLDTLPDITCFIPDNEAFQNIASTLATASPEDLTRILQYHAVNGSVGYSGGLQNGSTLTTLAGLDVTIQVSNGSIFVNSARVVTPDVLVANGVIHVIDGVLNPDNAVVAPNVTASTQTPAFSGASSGTEAPFTSGVPTPTSSINTEGPTSAASAAATGGGAAGGAASESSSAMAGMPMKTGAAGAAALFGGAAFLALQV